MARNGRSREEINEEELIGFIEFRFDAICDMVVTVTVMLKCTACNGLRRVVMVGGVHHVLRPLGHVGVMGASLCCCMLGGRIEF